MLHEPSFFFLTLTNEIDFKNIFVKVVCQEKVNIV